MARKPAGERAASTRPAKKKAAGDAEKAPRAPRRKAAAKASRGLAPADCLEGTPPDEVTALGEAVERDGGAVLARFRDPVGGAWQLLVALPVDLVQPAPFQRDLSDAHVKALEKVVDRLDRFIDPIVVVRTPEGGFWTPNGHHRLGALRRLGARAITCLLVPVFELAYQILALNTEKAPDLKARSLEVIRLARALADIAPARESDYAIQFDEEPGLLTLGVCYEQRPRFSGSVWRPLLNRCDGFLEQDLAQALAERARRGEALLRVDDLVSAHVQALKRRGADGPHVKTWLVGQLNPLRGGKGQADFDATLAKLQAKAEAFDPAAVDLRRLGVGAGGASADPPE